MLTSDSVFNDQSQSNHLNVNSDSTISALHALNLNLLAKGFKIGHLNIQGIQNKLDQLNLMLNNSRNDQRWSNCNL